MRRLQSYDDPEQARGLSDQLEIQGIENQVLSDEGSHAVWVVNEADLEAATQLASRYTGGPSDASRSEAERIRKQREAVARPVRAPGVSQAAGRAGGGPPGTLTLALIVLSVAVGVLSGLGDSSSPVLRALFVVPITPDGYYPVQIDWTQPWRLLTPMLIHFGIMHLVFNMLWLYRLGSQIENVQGMRVLLGLVVLTQVPGALAQFQLSGPLFGGMSGVVYGLFGFTWMQARYASRGYALSDQDTIWIMGWFALCATGLVGHVANAQHALGLVFGLLAGTPSYVTFRRSSTSVAFGKGSWADLNIRGLPRFRRIYFDPYVPLWFIGLAVVVLLVG
jgi:GlpG protein